MVKILPSVLSLDYRDTKTSLELLKKHFDVIHFDVMDGHFVPNLSFGPSIMKDFKEKTNLFMDVHIMVSNPMFVSELFIKQGADLITFHIEAVADRNEAVQLASIIRKQNCKVGISIKPNTSIEEILPILKHFDLVLVMSVEPGYGGQGFISSSLEKIRRLKEYKLEHKLDYIIEVDGGINQETAPLVIEAGAEWLVSGSYLFKGDMVENAKKMIKH